MTAIQNIKLYFDTLEGYEEFSANQQTHTNEISRYFPEEAVVGPAAECFATRVLSAFERGYHSFHDTAIRLSERYAPDWSSTIERRWEDPLSTEYLLKSCRSMVQRFQPTAVRRPTENRFFHYLDQSRISLAQRVVVFAKDTQEILQIPDQIRASIRYVPEEKETDQPALDMSIEAPVESVSVPSPVKDLLGRCWDVARAVYDSIRRGVLISVRKIAEFLAVPFHYLPIPLAEGALLWIVEKMNKKLNVSIDIKPAEGANTITHIIEQGLGQLADKALDRAVEEGRQWSIETTDQLIEQVHTTVRKRIVHNVAHHAFHYGLNVAAHWAIRGLAFYGLSYLPLSSYVSCGISAAWLYSWGKRLAPSVQRLYRSFTPNFDPNKSTLSELESLIREENIPKILRLLS